MIDKIAEEIIMGGCGVKVTWNIDASSNLATR